MRRRGLGQRRNVLLLRGLHCRAVAPPRIDLQKMVNQIEEALVEHTGGNRLARDLDHRVAARADRQRQRAEHAQADAGRRAGLLHRVAVLYRVHIGGAYRLRSRPRRRHERRSRRACRWSAGNSCCHRSYRDGPNSTHNPGSAAPGARPRKSRRNSPGTCARMGSSPRRSSVSMGLVARRTRLGAIRAHAMGTCCDQGQGLNQSDLGPARAEQRR
ncbi:hypothetical protein D9M68_277920 [compost metagenome]